MIFFSYLFKFGESKFLWLKMVHNLVIDYIEIILACCILCKVSDIIENFNQAILLKFVVII